MRWLLAIALVVTACDPRLPPRSVTQGATRSSPGGLIRGHATLACTDCHLASSPRLSPRACTTCHATIVARALENRGVHGHPAARDQPCTECHRDHRGASFDARWGFFGGVERFDHAYTGWALARGHRVACERCHAQAPRYTGAAVACAACHAPPHANTPFAKHACETCHATADDWKTLAFDHTEKTRFELGASHRHVACASCHAPQREMSPPPKACASCHAARDPHARRFGAMPCETCHAPSMSFAPGQRPPAWKPNAFDHRTTGWPLVGGHATIDCRACHRAPGTTLFAPLGRGKDCLGCHEHRAVHDRRYGNGQCLTCHTRPG